MSTLAILGLIFGIVEGVAKIVASVERIVVRILTYLRTSRKRKLPAGQAEVILPSSNGITARTQADYWFRACVSLCVILVVCLVVYALRKSGDGSLAGRRTLPSTV